MDKFNNLVREADIAGAASCSMRAVIPSGPCALETFRLTSTSSFSTSTLQHVRLEMAFARHNRYHEYQDQL